MQFNFSFLCVACYMSAVCCFNRQSVASSQPHVGVYVCPLPIAGLGSFFKVNWSANVAL